MEPASSIIRKLGGEAVVARETGMATTAPYRWQYPREKGGTDGTIPQKHHRALLDFAERSGVPLSADEFLPALSPPRSGSEAA